MLEPPVARRDPVVREHHGDRFEDPYAWMADRDGDELRELLAAENAWATECTVLSFRSVVRSSSRRTVALACAKKCLRLRIWRR